jgi:hypothetical protein
MRRVLFALGALALGISVSLAGTLLAVWVGETHRQAGRFLGWLLSPGIALFWSGGFHSSEGGARLALGLVVNCAYYILILRLLLRPWRR